MNWTDEYREIVEFYYWEPQHIGRAKGVKRFDGPLDMWNHVNKLEVSLNHVLNIFFSLYDSTPIFEKIGLTNNPYTFVSSRQLELWQKDIGGFTQPDIFFYGRNRNLAIELKLSSKTDLNQISKYVAFNSWIKNTTPLDLILLTPHSDLSQITKEKFTSHDKLIEQLRVVQLPKKEQLTCGQKTYEEQIDMLSITCLSIGKLYKILKKIKPSNNTEEKLLSGLLEYLSSRDLV